MFAELETLVVLCPLLVETHAPLFGVEAQKPPQTMFPFDGNAQPVSAAAELRETAEIAVQLAPSLVER
jgi:hypothetical protein